MIWRFEGCFGHQSFLEGRKLPAIEVLEQRAGG